MQVPLHWAVSTLRQHRFLLPLLQLYLSRPPGTALLLGQAGGELSSWATQCSQLVARKPDSKTKASLR